MARVAGPQLFHSWNLWVMPSSRTCAGMGTAVAVGGIGVKVGGSVSMASTIASAVGVVTWAAGRAVFVGGRLGVAVGMSSKLKSAVTATVGKVATSCLGALIS